MRSILIGIGLAVVTIVLVTRLPDRYSLDLLALLLAAIAAIYVGFALSDGRASSIVLEVGIAVVFILLAAGGRWFSPLLLAGAYGAHGVWDAIHHPKAIQTRIPSWYAPFCLAYDLVVGGFVALNKW